MFQLHLTLIMFMMNEMFQLHLTLIMFMMNSFEWDLSDQTCSFVKCFFSFFSLSLDIFRSRTGLQTDTQGFEEQGFG